MMNIEMWSSIGPSIRIDRTSTFLDIGFNNKSSRERI